MRNLVLFILCTTALAACSKKSDFPIKSELNKEVATLGSAEAQRGFAKLLSKAIYESREVRSFLKNEAIAQFDNDYDVFYPFIKDKIVANGKSFRDILLSYCADKDELIQIEASLPLLNILVPDLTLFWDFNAENWNIDNNEVAVICRDDQSNTIFGNGQADGLLPLDQIPGFPCLVVKNNERLKVIKAATRSAGAQYEFASDVFNAQLNHPQTRSYSTDIYLEPTDDSGPYVPANKMAPEIIEAYNRFKTNPYIIDRAYVYYGIDATNQSGELNPNIVESIYKFKIYSSAFSVIADQAGKDPALVKLESHRTMSNEEILKQIWTDGKFEIYLHCYNGADGATAVTLPKVFTLSAK